MTICAVGEVTELTTEYINGIASVNFFGVATLNVNSVGKTLNNTPASDL